MDEVKRREEMVALGASLFNRGYSSGSGGNMSVRLVDGTVLATPTNSSLGRLVPERLSKVAQDGRLLAGDPPSKECAFHLAIYAARPNCGAVVHLHSTYAVALSCCKHLPQEVIRPFTPYFVMKVAPLVLLPYFKPGSRQLVEAVAANAGTARSFLLANHGPIVTGRTLEEAVNAMEELEETARLFFLFRQSQSDIRYLTDEEIAQLQDKK